MDAVVTRSGDGVEIHFDLHLRHPVSEVWAALTDGARLAEWLGTGSVDARVGGRVSFKSEGESIEGDVIEARQPSSLAYRMSGPQGQAGVARWTLTEEGLGTHLALAHQMPSGGSAVERAAGWHAHLELLSAALDDLPSNWSKDRWTTLRDYYEKKLG
jgi:uncharacterized protein YndB with AHSA1/START domain